MSDTSTEEKSPKPKLKLKTEDRKSITAKKTYFAIILDKSWSMGTIKEQAIGGFNETIGSIKSEYDPEEMEVGVFLTLFNNRTQIVHTNVKPDKIEELTDKDYIANGGTALLDAIADTLDALNEMDDINDEGTSVHITIISDGEENSSTHADAKTIKNRLEELKGSGRWTDVWIAANQNLDDLEKYGASAGNVIAYSATAGGTAALNNVTSRGVKSFMKSRAGGQSASTNYAMDMAIVRSDDLLNLSYQENVVADANYSTLDNAGTTTGTNHTPLAVTTDPTPPKVKVKKEEEDKT